jgi:hypothetical protein
LAVVVFRKSCSIIIPVTAPPAPDLNYTLNTSSANCNYPNSIQRGGILSWLTGPWTCRIFERESDELGRWTLISLKGTKTNLTVIVAYQPCPSTKGSNSAASQQVAMLRTTTDRVSASKPRRLFIKDLSLRIKQAKEQKTRNPPNS